MRELLIVLSLIGISGLQGCVPLVAGGAAAGGVLVAQDRRTFGAITEDEALELKASRRIKEDFLGAHVDVTSFNRVMLLTGEAPTQQMKSDIENTLARDLANVRAIQNELIVAAPSALSARSNDAYLTSKVKARMVEAQQFHPTHVKVVTSNDVVYLMGLVTQEEANQATEIARSTGGVQKVVKVFEYIN
ncbi:MAG TPA: BON domain-containing protein [Burkholderiales bacterium]|nr:BON domain-containing protein [Burkholderiales bacterium]